MAELTPIRGSKFPIGTRYASPRLDEHQLLSQGMSYHKKLARVKHLQRNNYLARSVVNAMRTYVAGNGLNPIGADSTRLAIWNGWSKCADMAQTKRFELVLHDIVEAMCAGDCLVVLRSRSVIVEGRVNSFIDIVNSGRIETPVEFVDNVNPETKNNVILGVEYDRDGVELGYWVIQNSKLPLTFGNFVFVPRFNKKTGRFISLLVRNPKTAPNSVRGGALIDAVIPEVEDCASLSDSGVQAGIVKNSISIGLEMPIANTVYAAMDALNSDKTLKQDINPNTNELTIVGDIPFGNVFNMPQGGKIHTVSHSGNIDMIQLVELVKRNFASGVGIPYEILFNNYAGVNFSAGKLLHDPFWRDVQQWVSVLADLTQMLFEAVTDEGLLVRGLSPLAYIRNVSAWVGAPRTEADEGKSATAATSKISGGLMAPSVYHAERGESYADMLAKYKECIDMEVNLFGESWTLASLKSSALFKHLIFNKEASNDTTDA